jgi:hypothetical protein
LVCHDDRRQFVIMPLSKDSALPPQEDTVQIPSTETVTKQSVTARRKPTMKTPAAFSTTNGDGIAQPKTDSVAIPENGNGVRQPKTHPVAVPQKMNNTGLDALLAEAEGLKTSLRDAYTRTNQLLLAIKRHKKQAHAVRATLASLRQLQHIDA